MERANEFAQPTQATYPTSETPDTTQRPTLTVIPQPQDRGGRQLALHLQRAVDDPHSSMTEEEAWSYMAPEKKEPEIDLDAIQVCAHLRNASRADALRWMGYKVPEGYKG